MDLSIIISLAILILIFFMIYVLNILNNPIIRKIKNYESFKDFCERVFLENKILFNQNVQSFIREDLSLTPCAECGLMGKKNKMFSVTMYGTGKDERYYCIFHKKPYDTVVMDDIDNVRFYKECVLVYKDGNKLKVE